MRSIPSVSSGTVRLEYYDTVDVCTMYFLCYSFLLEVGATGYLSPSKSANRASSVFFSFRLYRLPRFRFMRYHSSVSTSNGLLLLIL